MSDFTIDNILDSMGVEVEDLDDSIARLNTDMEKAGMKTQSHEEKKAEDFTFSLTDFDRQRAYNLGLISQAYINARFDIEMIRQNLIKGNTKIKNGKPVYEKKVVGFPNYTKICTGILSALRFGQLPDRSYIIGAEKGFGKESFVSECLITMAACGMKTVPYISLFELACIKNATENKLLNPYKVEAFNYVDAGKNKVENNKEQEPETRVSHDVIALTDVNVDSLVRGEVYKRANTKELQKAYADSYDKRKMIYEYNYLDYLTADCLFLYFQDCYMGYTELELFTLQAILSVRGVKGLPTIVVTESGIDKMKYSVGLRTTNISQDRINPLRSEIYNALFTSNKDHCRYSKLYHVSTFYTEKSLIDDDGKVDKETGIEKDGNQ